MRFKRMFLLAGMSLAVTAFAAPGAQANLTLTDKGVALGNGAKVTMTSKDLQTKSAAGTIKCKLVTLHYELANVGASSAELVPVPSSPTEADNGTAEECHVETGGVGGPTDVVHLSKFGTKAFTINTWGTGLADTTMNMLITPSTNCSFTGKLHIQGQASGTDEVTIGPSGLTGPCGAGTFNGTGTLETPDGTPILLDFTKTG